LIVRLPLPSLVLWSAVAVIGAGTVLSYAIVAEYFPEELTGRANGALNVFHFGWAFVLQYAIGLVLQQWPSQDGHFPTIAYQVAFSINLGLQIAALTWFELARVVEFFRPLAQVATSNAPTRTVPKASLRSSVTDF
jgi:MFS family permease